jgi:hypothetical protein
MDDEASGASNTNLTVPYEETIAIKDEEGAGSLVSWVRIVIVFMVIVSLVSIALVAIVATRGMAVELGGMSVLQQFVGELLANQTIVVGAFLLATVLFLLIGGAFVWLLVKNVGRATDKEVHIQVSDDEVSVERKGSQYWQSSGVDVPFDTITTVEYLDSQESSMRLELGDFRAPKFFGGRSRDWIRLERAQGPAIYVGSDRPRELAEAIARHVPGNVSAKPF